MDEELKLNGVSSNTELLLPTLSGDGDLVVRTGDLFLDIGGSFGPGMYFSECFFPPPTLMLLNSLPHTTPEPLPPNVNPFVATSELEELFPPCTE